jgi:TetR/AcrR family transcriptional repressor of nem operon
MARPREFDEIAVLEAAVDCFWKRGYEATSIRDLAASTGLSAPSLYNAFGDKRTLYAKALERYLDCTARRISHWHGHWVYYRNL